METLYKSGVVKPKLIQYALRNKLFDEPSVDQINNWIKYYKKKKLDLLV